ncbi:MAG: hypothetical protein RL113_1377 [Pseudomonadota bacterium]|jgi:hypothetical protein
MKDHILAKRLTKSLGFFMMSMTLFYTTGFIRANQTQIDNMYQNMTTEHLQIVAERVSQHGNVPPLLTMELIKRWSEHS